jgi:hypothetical protein
LQDNLLWEIKNAKYIKEMVLPTESEEGSPCIVEILGEVQITSSKKRMRTNVEIIPLTTVNYILNNLS